MNLAIVFLIATAYCYPIAITNTDLSQKDLFINQSDLIERLKTQNKKITILNIQTSYGDGEQFMNKLLTKLEGLKIRKVLKSKSTFVSPYVEYQPNQLMKQLQKESNVEIIPINFLNLAAMDKFAKSQDSILIVMFSKISSNVKVLQEIADSGEEESADETTLTDESDTTTPIIAVEIGADESDEMTENTIYTVTSNQLTGYLVFFAVLFALWIGIQCNAAIQTPDRFSRLNYFVGKES